MLNWLREHKDKYPNMPYKRMDVKQLESVYDPGTFDAVIDKGLFDCIQCGDEANKNSDSMLREISKVLSPNGVFICVSQGHPTSRLVNFQKDEFGWVVTQEKVAKPFVKENSQDEKDYNWVYIMRKQGAAAEKKAE